jgi:hypothetical protein
MKKTKLIVILLLSFIIANAQEFILHKYGIIKENDNLNGYYFLKSEQKSRKEREFTLELYDSNLSPVTNITFTSAPQYTVNEILFSDNAIFVRETKQIREEKFIGNVSIIDLKAKTIKGFELPNEDVQNCTYFFLPGNTIIRCKQVYKNFFWNSCLESVDMNNVIKWTMCLPDEEFEKASMYPGIRVINETEGLIQVSKTGGKVKGYFSDYRLINFKTGKLIRKFDSESSSADSKYTPSLIKPLADGGYVIAGVYKPGEKLSKDDPEAKNKEGLYLQRYDKTGNITMTKKFTFNEYFKKALPAKKADKLNMDYLRIKELVFTNNKIKVIIAGGTIGFSYLAFRVQEKALYIDGDKAYDIVGNGLFSFDVDKEFNFLSWNTLNNRINDPAFKSENQKFVVFDYDSPVYNKEKDALIVNAYVPKNKMFGDGKGRLVSLLIKDSQPVKADEFPVNDEATIVDFFEAKPGYIMVFEYFEKEKKMTKRLEKLTY